MTRDMIYNIIRNPEKFMDSYVRFYKGNIYSEDEFQKLVGDNPELILQKDESQLKLQR